MGWYGMIWDDMGWYGMIWDDMGWYGMIWDLPSGYVKIAIENGNWNSGFSHWTWWFATVMLVYQRVCDITSSRDQDSWTWLTMHVIDHPQQYLGYIPKKNKWENFVWHCKNEYLAQIRNKWVRHWACMYIYIYREMCPNGHFMPLFMAIFMAYTPPHSHWTRDTMIKVIWHLPGRQVASPQGISAWSYWYESWVFDKENLSISQLLPSWSSSWIWFVKLMWRLIMWTHQIPVRPSSTR